MKIVVTSPFDYDEPLDSEANALMVGHTWFDDSQQLQIDCTEIDYEDKKSLEACKKLGWFGVWKIKQLK